MGSSKWIVRELTGVRHRLSFVGSTELTLDHYGSIRIRPKEILEGHL